MFYRHSRKYYCTTRRIVMFLTSIMVIMTVLTPIDARVFAASKPKFEKLYMYSYLGNSNTYKLVNLEKEYTVQWTVDKKVTGYVGFSKTDKTKSSIKVTAKGTESSIKVYTYKNASKIKGTKYNVTANIYDKNGKKVASCKDSVKIATDPTSVKIADITLDFDSYGSYEDDVDHDGVKETVWIVPIGGSYKVDKTRSSIDMNSFDLMYDMIDILPEPLYIKGKPHYVQYMNVGTQKGLEWYGSLNTFVGCGMYEGPDTEYYFDMMEIIYVDMGPDSENCSFSDLAAAIFNGKYPMSDPVPKEFYCLSAVKKGTADALKTWYFKVLPYEYASPEKVNATVCGSDVTFHTYNIKGYNYFNIRDLAAAFKGTRYAFDVEWDQLGGEIYMGRQSNDVICTESLGTEAMHAVHSNGGILTKGDDIKLMECYMINDSNYYKISDLAAFLGFNVNYDSITGKIYCQ